MTTTPFQAGFDRIRTQALLGAGTVDGELLRRFIELGEASAFESLVRRHGPMVLAVCRRILRNDDDAEDAFQATFLVLALKARTIRRKEGLANWLHGVAHNTAMKARFLRRKRQAKERLTGKTEYSGATVEQETDQKQLLAYLDVELRLLPPHYRTPIVLCDLEGQTIQEAANASGCPTGTIASRLVRGRSLLARRLSRHGLTLSVGALAASIAEATAAGIPSSLIGSVVRSGSALTTGNALIPGVVPSPILVLTEGVLKMMFFKKLMTTGLATVAAAMGFALVGAIAFAYSAAPAVAIANTHRVVPDAAAQQTTPVPPKPPRPATETVVDPISAYLLLNPLVAKELKLTDEQKKKIDEGLAPIQKEMNDACAEVTAQTNALPEGDKKRAELAEEFVKFVIKSNEKMGKAYLGISKTVLQPEQAKRVDQIMLQVRFPSYMNPRVITTLKLTEDQQKKVMEVILEYNTAIGEWAKPTADTGTPKHSAEQIRITRTTSGKFNDLLTKNQQSAWKEMIGNEIPLEKIFLGSGGLPPSVEPSLQPPPIVVDPPQLPKLPPPPKMPKPHGSPQNGKSLSWTN